MHDNNFQKDDVSMSPHKFSDHELVAAYIEKRLTDNLACFKEHLPEIYETFKCYREDRFYLIYDESGNINVFDKKNESLIYSKNPVAQTLGNLEDYIKSPIQRPFFITPQKEEEKDLVNYLHSGFMGDLADSLYRVLNGVVVEDFKNLLNKDSRSNVFKLKNTINSIFLFSTGLGFDVERLCFDNKVRNLFIIEPSLDSFYLSLQLIDWAGIVEKSRNENTKIFFLLGDEVVSSLSTALNSAGRHNAAGAFLYSPFFIEEFKDIFSQVKNIVANSTLTGFGFYDDSRYSLAHTLGNIKNDVPLLSTNKKIKKNLGQDKIPAFVIGNGPSLDDEIDFLKKVQDKVVIYSCGSSLKPLLQNNIVPDYYVEMERTSIVTYFINNSFEGIDGYYEKLKGIKFIAVSQVDPEAFNFFEKKGMLLKDNETGSMLALKTFNGDSVPVVPRLAPTCVHTGFSLAVIMGYRDIYLFGTDMGTLDPSRHHSKYSLYSKAKGETAKSLAIDKNGDIYPSNFGSKEVYSSGFYPVSKHHLESIIDGWKSNYGSLLNVYNCSDGALLKGAEPKKSCDIDIDFNVDNNVKEKIATSVFDAFFSLRTSSKYDIALDELDHIKKVVCKACDWSIDYLHAIDSIDELFDLLDRFRVDFHSNKVMSDDDAWLYTLFDGSLLYAMSIINTSMQLAVDDQILLEEANKQLESFKKFFSDVKTDFSENCLEWDKEERHSKFLGGGDESENI